jgi:hypothetical protein
LQQIKQVEKQDEWPIESESISHDRTIWIAIHDQVEPIAIIDTMLKQYPFIIGIPSLQFHHIRVWFTIDSITCPSHYCLMHCDNASITLQGGTEERRKGIYLPTEDIVELD